MGCCSTSPRPDTEINYETKECDHDVEFENASDPKGERLVEGLAKFFKSRSAFHTSMNSGITEGFFRHFGNGEAASALQIWGD